MGKLESLMKAHGANISDSFGTSAGHAAPALPPGMSLADAQRAPSRDQGVTRSKNAVEIPTDRIVRDPDQPREEFDEEAIDRLAESMKTKGQLQPIRVRWSEGQGAYVVVMGERRWRAAARAGLATLSCIVHQGQVEPAELLALQVIENCLREDLKPIEQARAYRKLQELYGWSGNRLAKELSIPQPAIVQALKLLDLPESIQAKVEAGELAPRTAYEISKLEDEADRVVLAERAAAERLTGGQVADVVKARKAGKDLATPGSCRAEFKLAAGCKVVVSGLPDQHPDTVIARLREAIKQAQRLAREGAGGQAA